jgi:hypothetical protein
MLRMLAFVSPGTSVAADGYDIRRVRTTRSWLDEVCGAPRSSSDLVYDTPEASRQRAVTLVVDGTQYLERPQ